MPVLLRLGSRFLKLERADSLQDQRNAVTETSSYMSSYAAVRSKISGRIDEMRGTSIKARSARQKTAKDALKGVAGLPKAKRKPTTTTTIPKKKVRGFPKLKSAAQKRLEALRKIK